MRNYIAEQLAARVVKIKDALHHIGKFTISAELKEGANAYAFKAFHNNLQREVFLKVYDYTEEENSVLLREPQILQQLTQTSPRCVNIVEIYDIDVFETEGGKYLCLQMEFVPTHSLLGALHTTPIGPQDAIRIVLGVLNGVSHFHTNSFVHRDLKPANILLCADGCAKITDLGSAARLSTASSMVTASRHSALYVPPEGWANPSTFGIRSDLYQVGMILYELINGPLEARAAHYEQAIAGGKFRGGTADSAICRLAEKSRLLEHGRPPRPYYSKRLKSIISKATNPNYHKRFTSAVEFRTKLGQINVPNWNQIESGVFQAINWVGKDWRVSTIDAIKIEKCATGSGKFRRTNDFEFGSLSECFAAIEEL